MEEWGFFVVFSVPTALASAPCQSWMVGAGGGDSLTFLGHPISRSQAAL